MLIGFLLPYAAVISIARMQCQTPDAAGWWWTYFWILGNLRTNLGIYIVPRIRSVVGQEPGSQAYYWPVIFMKLSQFVRDISPEQMERAR